MRTMGWISMMVCASLLLPFGQLEVAAAKRTCTATPWPYSSTQSKRDLSKLFESSKRPALVEYFFGELTSPKPESRVAYYLGKYLAQTEATRDMSSFYKAVAIAADVTEETSKKRQLDLKELCAAWDAARALKK